MADEDLRARILASVHARSEERHVRVVSAAEVTADATIGDRVEIARVLVDLVLVGDLRAVLAGGGVFIAIASPRQKRRRAALAELTKRVLDEMSRRGDPLENLVHAIRIVDSVDR